MILKCAFLFAVFSSAISNVLRDEFFPLDLIHYNDFHDRFEETSVELPICQLNDSSCLGGFARLAYEIKALLKEKPDALLLNAGDVFQGTYWYSMLKWNVTQHFIDMLPNDAHTIGNHEFDDGVEGLAPYLKALRAPVVIANIDSSEEPLLNGLYTPRIVVERKGRKIGIIGVTTTDSKRLSSPGNIKFMDPVETVKGQAQTLVEQGVDIVIILSHCGLLVDKQIAQDAGENVDIIVGGHSHSLLWNGPSPSNETVQGTYPELVQSKSNAEHKVLILQASAFTKYLGNITIYFNKQGELMSYDAGPIFLNRSIPEDPEIKALLQPYSATLHKMMDEVVGYSMNELAKTSCFYGECELGNLIADAFLDSAKEANKSNLTDVAFIFSNVIRSVLPKGDVTRGALVNVSPFGNKVISVTVAGRYIVEAVESALTYSWSEKPFASLRMPAFAGMKVTLNTTSGKLESVFVGDAEQPLVLDEEYRLTLLHFYYKGENGLDAIKKNGRDLTFVGKDADILEKYVKKVSPIDYALDSNRLVIVT